MCWTQYRAGHSKVLDTVKCWTQWYDWIKDHFDPYYPQNLCHFVKFFIRNHLEKNHQNHIKNKIFSYHTKLNSTTPTTLTPFNSKWQKIEKICWHTTESSHWQELNAKNPTKIGWKIKISHLLQNHIFYPLNPFIPKLEKATKKCLQYLILHFL